MSSVRIIGGELRSRRIIFSDIPGLRPTQDRIRETLFNWLAPYIRGATCLDLFAGSGVLGFESLSRGAKSVCFVDNHPKVLADLRVNAEKLTINSLQWTIIRGEIPNWMPQLPQAPFDIIFLDPPFHQGLLPAAIYLFAKYTSDCQGALIYMEMENTLTLDLPPTWQIHRQEKTATLIYQLVKELN